MASLQQTLDLLHGSSLRICDFFEGIVVFRGLLAQRGKLAGQIGDFALRIRTEGCGVLIGLVDDFRRAGIRRGDNLFISALGLAQYKLKALAGMAVILSRTSGGRMPRRYRAGRVVASTMMGR